MMGRLRAMREPLKYVQGRDALLKFHEEMGYMGKRWLVVCSNSGYKACHYKIEKTFGDLDDYRRYEVFGGISSNGEINKRKAIVEADNIDTVVAVGGGSAVDTAKAFLDAGAEQIHMVDLDGAKDGTHPNYPVVRRVIEQTGAAVELRGCIRARIGAGRKACDYRLCGGEKSAVCQGSLRKIWR